MKKTIKYGVLTLKEVKKETLESKEEEAKELEKIPTYTVPVVDIIPVEPQNCKGGDIDACQNYEWCAQCINVSRAETGPCEKIIIGSQELLDIPKYLEQMN